MAFLNIHPAPGLGVMLPGWWTVPNNPFSPPVPVGVAPSATQELAEELANARPRNAIAEAVRAIDPTARGPVTVHGLGAAFNLDEALDFSKWDWTTWLLIGGAALLLLSSMRKNRLSYKAAKYQAKADYYKSIAAAKAESPTMAAYWSSKIRPQNA
jgi:hypothetical protein